ncbi:hypothetical protein [Cytobacillus purgationiresistens]|uniref:Exosporium leader peptide n=1 Tax=Cytobacillus purgationiresistens TaxID=863449 RepID=A0ABU0AEP2_9BACI|nr:hypothetical protein [Cytobacillus purgationiresistens]MDQ0269725.1 hypothetical protein [Cytobacillus purgationiresistens]
MGKFLDAQTSQNASTNGAISIPVTTTPALFGTLGLSTAGAGANIRVGISLSVTFSSLASVLTPIRVDIYRGQGPGRALIYSATDTLPVAGLGLASTTVLSFNAADFNPTSADNFLVYQAFISAPGGILLLPTRTGPETFYAAAYSDNV